MLALMCKVADGIVSPMCGTEQVIRCAIKFLLRTPLTFGQILAIIMTVLGAEESHS